MPKVLSTFLMLDNLRQFFFIAGQPIPLLEAHLVHLVVNQYSCLIIWIETFINVKN